VELLIGFIPIIGDISDVSQAFAGVDIWGERLGTGDRAVMLLGAMIPFVPGSALRRGRRLASEVAQDLAQTTGRHADEIMPFIRAADSFRSQDVELINAARRAVQEGQQLNPEQVRRVEEVLERVSRDLRAPLPGAVRRGTREFVHFTEESIEHVGVRHVPEMFDPVASLRELNQQGLTDPNHVTHLFPPGMASSDHSLTTLMRQAIEFMEAGGLLSLSEFLMLECGV
jgi:hypothetical protein